MRTPDQGKQPEGQTQPSKAPSPPAASNPAVAVDSPTARKENASAYAQQPLETRVTIIRGKNQAVPEWTGGLTNLPQVRVSFRAGSDGCLALGGAHDILFHSDQKADAATRIGQKLSLPDSDVKSMSRENLDRCGGGDLLAMPANPSLIKRAGDSLGEVVKDAEKKADSAKKKAGEVLEKGKEKLPPLPPPPPQ
jgi:hypothetical protein